MVEEMKTARDLRPVEPTLPCLSAIRRERTKRLAAQRKKCRNSQTPYRYVYTRDSTILFKSESTYYSQMRKGESEFP
nr:hypothetical transcript [Hymenolepis microstoma]